MNTQELKAFILLKYGRSMRGDGWSHRIAKPTTDDWELACAVIEALQHEVTFYNQWEYFESKSRNRGQLGIFMEEPDQTLDIAVDFSPALVAFNFDHDEIYYDIKLFPKEDA